MISLENDSFIRLPFDYQEFKHPETLIPGKHGLVADPNVDFKCGKPVNSKQNILIELNYHTDHL